MKKKIFIGIAVFISSFVLFYFLKPNKTEQNLTYYSNVGEIFGSTYHIKYQHSSDLQPKIDSILKAYDESVSPYKPNSIISRINRNDSAVVLDNWMETLIKVGIQVGKETDGAFDITIEPLVEAWGFSFKKKRNMNPALVDSLKALVDYRKIKVANHRLIKEDSKITVDCISMGDGYATDIIADFLEKEGIKNYLVEIGGEIKVKGINSSSDIWNLGIDKPVDQSDTTVAEIQQILKFSNGALSTSGNYRNFYYKDGKKYAHTIDPKTGYPVQHSLLSATIISPSCIEADAYSTACMVIGLEKSLELLKKLPHLEGYFIYSDAKGAMRVTYTAGFKKFLKD
ncbi:MAG: FAD:protein FMN transferase [Bacteroidales bacterium]